MIEVVELTRTYPVSAEVLYRAFADPEWYRRWAWGSLGVETRATVDCRPGGAYEVSTARPDGDRWSFSGVFRECVPGTRLVYTVAWSAPMGYESDEERVEVTLVPRDGATELSFVHHGVPLAEARAEHRKGWADTLEALARVLEQEAATL